jgi:hypothetical protein
MGMDIQTRQYFPGKRVNVHENLNNSNLGSTICLKIKKNKKMASFYDANLIESTN